MNEQTLSPRQRALASGLLLLLVYSSLVNAWPVRNTSRLRGRFLGPLGSIVSFFGLSYELGLFLPNPPRKNRRVFFQVTFDDGASEEFRFPRSRMMPFDQRDSYLRYVRNAVFTLRRSSRAARYWPDVARFVAAQEAATGRRPKTVVLGERWGRIPSPRRGVGHPELGVRLNHQRNVFTYQVPQ